MDDKININKISRLWWLCYTRERARFHSHSFFVSFYCDVSDLWCCLCLSRSFSVSRGLSECRSALQASRPYEYTWKIYRAVAHVCHRRWCCILNMRFFSLVACLFSVILLIFCVVLLLLLSLLLLPLFSSVSLFFASLASCYFSLSRGLSIRCAREHRTF